MATQQELYDESLSCRGGAPLQDERIYPVVLWRTLERTHTNLFCPEELVKRFVTELAMNIAESIQTAAMNGDLPDSCEDAADFIVNKWSIASKVCDDK